MKLKSNVSNLIQRIEKKEIGGAGGRFFVSFPNMRELLEDQRQSQKDSRMN